MKRVSVLVLVTTVGCVADALPLGPAELEPPEDPARDGGARRDLGPPSSRGKVAYDCLPVLGYLFCLEPLVFTEARAQCLALGGDVVFIETAEENRRVSEAFSRWSPREFWIGMSDALEEGSWRWLDARPVGPYTAWDVGEPNDLGGEDCAHNSWGEVGVWNDISCFDLYPTVCELPPGEAALCDVDDDCLRSFGRCVDSSCVPAVP